MQPIGQSYDWVYANVRTGEFTCVRIAGNSCIIRDLKANLEKLGDLFFPVVADGPIVEHVFQASEIDRLLANMIQHKREIIDKLVAEAMPIECFKCGRRHGLLLDEGYTICDYCRGVHEE